MAVIPCTVKSSGYSDAKQEQLIRIKEDKEGPPNTNEDRAVLRQELQWTTGYTETTEEEMNDNYDHE